MDIKRALLFLAILLIASQVFSQTGYTSKCKKAFSSIGELRFEEAEKLLEEERQVNPNNRVIFFLEDYIDFFKVFISEKETLYEKALDRRQQRLKKINELPDSNPFKDYLKGEIYLRWASVKGKMNSKLSAVVDINKAYRLLKRNHSEFPDFAPGQAGLGILEVLIGTIPEKYEWLTNLLNLEGTIGGGKERIKDLFEISQSDSSWTFLEYPTLFMMSFIEMNTQQEIDEDIMNRYHAYDSAGILKDQPLLIFAYANLLQKKRMNEKTLAVLNYYKKDSKRYPFYYLDYMKGLAYLFKNSQKCIFYFDSYLNHFPGRHYIKSSYQKKAWYYLLNGDTARYKNYIHYAGTRGEDDIGVDKGAEKEAESNVIPNVHLLKARLRFDGGYYQKALEALGRFDRRGKKDVQLTEWHYRKARIYHEKGKLAEAMKAYYKSYDIGKDLEAYFAANSALLAGQILEKKDQPEKALEQYNKALDLSGFEYELSIHQKAKAGKARILD